VARQTAQLSDPRLRGCRGTRRRFMRLRTGSGDQVRRRARVLVRPGWGQQDGGSAGCWSKKRMSAAVRVRVADRDVVCDLQFSFGP
jgi:hypothetical protein